MKQLYQKFKEHKGNFFQKCVPILKINVFPKIPKNRDKVLCDLGFAYLKVNEPQKAIPAFRQISEASYKSTVGAALACFKAEEFEESYSIYTSALEWLAQTDVQKSSILIAMAAMVYTFQGENDAKTLLFQW